MPRRLGLMLYTRRKRVRERGEAEARGESFWTATFNEKVRRRLLYAAGEAAKGDLSPLMEQARRLILKDEGDLYLQSFGPQITPAQDFHDHFMACADEVLPTAIEALYIAMQSFAVKGHNYVVPTIDYDEFRREVHQILEEERVAFDFASGLMVPFESKELYQAVMEPAIKLLHNLKFPEAEKAYQHALEEVTGGKPGDAITDAGTALQEILKALGCEGKSLGPLIKSAREKGLLVAHDAYMTKAIEDIMVWVAADRNEMGDSHNADKAMKEDAWFIIHVVGALVVRLVGVNKR